MSDSSVVLAADHLGLVVLERELEEFGLDVPGVAAALAAAVEAEHQVQRRLLLDVVVGQRALVLQLLPGEDQALLVRRDPCNSIIYMQCMLAVVLNKSDLIAAWITRRKSS